MPMPQEEPTRPLPALDEAAASETRTVVTMPVSLPPAADFNFSHLLEPPPGSAAGRSAPPAYPPRDPADSWS